MRILAYEINESVKQSCPQSGQKVQRRGDICTEELGIASDLLTEVVICGLLLCSKTLFGRSPYFSFYFETAYLRTP